MMGYCVTNFHSEGQREKNNNAFNNFFKLPAPGIEPLTLGLQVQRSPLHHGDSPLSGIFDVGTATYNQIRLLPDTVVSSCKVQFLRRPQS